MKATATAAVIRRALVGWTGSNQDRERMFSVMEWMEQHEERVRLVGQCNNDEIDLSKGRDFLREDKRYDIVILHYIFNPHMSYARYMDAAKKHLSASDRKRLALSPDHRDERWNQRLKETGAKVIFVFYDGSMELGPENIGNIDGYILLDDTPWGMSVYEKKQQEQQ